MGNLSLLKNLYKRVVVPLEVHDEILAGGSFAFGVREFQESEWLNVRDSGCNPGPILMHSLDIGEAAVIQSAFDLSVSRVCIDEALGRRVARLHGLNVTGSLGVILKAIREGHEIDLRLCIDRMRIQGVWISKRTEDKALRMAANIRDERT